MGCGGEEAKGDRGKECKHSPGVYELGSRDMPSNATPTKMSGDATVTWCKMMYVGHVVGVFQPLYLSVNTFKQCPNESAPNIYFVRVHNGAPQIVE